MSTITKEWLQQKIADMEAARDEIPFGLDEDDSNTLAALRIALALYEAVPVAYADPQTFRNFQAGAARREWMWRNPGEDLIPVYTAPPAPGSDPVAWEWFYYKQWNTTNDPERAKDVADGGVEVFPLYRRASIHHGANAEQQRKSAIHDELCEKYNVESLEAFVDWQRNHIAELEAAPPAPVGEGETAVMPDYPGYTMTQRECYQAGKKAGMAEAGNSPVIPDGWALVPIDPTEDMIVNGFESEPDESFSDEKEWEAYVAKSGCQRAAHWAKLCWAAMPKASQKQSKQ